MTPGKLIPTDDQLRIILLGKLGRGPAEMVHLCGAAGDAGYDYAHCVAAIPVALAEMVAEGKAECVQVPSPFTKAEYRVWRLAGSVPMESSAAVEPGAAHGPAAGAERLTSAQQWRADAMKRGRK